MELEWTPFNMAALTEKYLVISETDNHHQDEARCVHVVSANAYGV